MGLLKKTNRKIKSERKQDFLAFQEEMAKVSQKYGFRIRPIITPYGPNIDFVDIGKKSEIIT